MAKITIDKLDPASPTTGAENLIISQNGETVRLPLSLLPVGNSVAFKGGAETTTDPGTPTGPIYYIATEPGTYTNFLDSTSTAITVAAGEYFVILSFDGTNWVKQVVTIDLSGYVETDNIADDLNTQDPSKVLSAKQGSLLNTAINLFVEFIDKTAAITNDSYIEESNGSTVDSAGYMSSGLVDVVPGQKVKYHGYAGGSTAGSITVCPVAGYDSSGNYVGAVVPNIDPDGTGGEVDTVTIIPNGVAKIIGSFRQNPEDPMEFGISSVKGTQQIGQNSENIDTLSSAVASISGDVGKLFSPKDISGEILVDEGYVSNVDGSFVPAANYLSSDFLEVKAGEKMYYTGKAGHVVSPVAGYDLEGNYVFNPLITDPVDTTTFTNVEIIIPVNVVQIRVSARNNPGDETEFKKIELNVKFEDLDTDSVKVPKFFMPSKIFGRSGEMVRMYPNGILSVRDMDVRWSIPGGTQSFWQIENPTTADDGKEVTLRVYDTFGEDKKIGNTTINIVNTVQSPANPMVVLCIGDSLTQGTNSSIDAGWVNEFSRRLTGVGTGIGDIQPVSDELSNIQFVGTRGSSPVKAEGRGGWSAGYYLTLDERVSVVNAFWDGSKFSIDYYLTSNGFYSPTLAGGVDATGSNLVVYILLGWNDIRLDGIEQYKINLAQMVDIIISELPSVNIKLLGLEHPPADVYRADKSNWSPRAIMENFVIPQHEAGAEIANMRSNVEHLPVSAFFSEVGSFSVSNNNANRRVNDQLSIVKDNVHCNDNGYAQIADVAYYNFLYNYCNGD